MIESIARAKVGEIVPIIKVIDNIDPLELYSRISDYGRKKNSLYIDFRGRIIGSADPCLRIRGIGDTFEIQSLNENGIKFLGFIKNDFKFCDKVVFAKGKLTGKIQVKNKAGSEDERLKQKSHLDVLRKVAFTLQSKAPTLPEYSGLFGAFTYEFIHQSHCQAGSHPGLLYDFFFLDNLFVTDTNTGKTSIIASALVVDSNLKKLEEQCHAKISAYEKALKDKQPKPGKFKPVALKGTSLKDKASYEKDIHEIKKSIYEGDIYQAFYMRSFTSNFNCEPLDLFKSLIKHKPRSYQFFLNLDKQILIGSSPEMGLSVQGEKEKTVEVSLIARTKPVSYGKPDLDIENRFEAELKTDWKELSKHIMAIDCGRSDIARVSSTGSRHLDKLFITERYPIEQNLVSNVKGTLAQGLDAFHAFQACMGRISGVPKCEAMDLLKKLENKDRGFFYGTLGYINPDKDMHSCIIKNALILESSTASFSVTSEILYDSIIEDKYRNSENKAKVFVDAIRNAGGIK